ncbi:MAG: hypothetical protein A3G32_09915 [Deltaproteobacteria bacterium RIFCSPLOWO2_12_FULL_40_28]|nr:MAG: hypothetical protein A3C45_04925 [Deltaproteobacteria bacterium RIFCSPHIGHO2_02_FULL_40_28]OGQ20347.1 MAG: hypothetical protein A3E27_00305 [Deltaproteobacteria bacterium RIFCSPHIGHO2_12_FULL_40_32]OGQ41316.1 MAG: hypothetical protein A3I69_01955 [Deltaproteobacteria bacterium RIFCSPLOWO2_02_FULL_40_36]OGQ54955.1 MAG: hypothetical protein A3G32_09915 [Deltaproteobacteria bacterium RIFCSPLOWO2_12_FULL_40_28]
MGTLKKFKPLKGITVVDLSRLLPGPYCSFVLASLGAKVMKVEDSELGDYLKHYPPFVSKGEGREGREGLFYHALNFNKKKITLNLRDKKGIKTLYQLCKTSDVVIESYRPGVFSKMGFSYQKLKSKNKKIILASITGYGQKTSMSHLAGHDLNFMSLAGLIKEEALPSIQWADLVGGGIWSALMIMSALYQANFQGKGSHLDLSMSHAMRLTGMLPILLSQFGGEFFYLSGGLARYGIYKTKDNEKIALAALETKFWNPFCDIIKKPEWKDGEKTFLDANPQIKQELKEIFLQKTREEWTRQFQNLDLCFTPVLNLQEIFSKKDPLSGDFLIPFPKGCFL